MLEKNREDEWNHIKSNQMSFILRFSNIAVLGMKVKKNNIFSKS